MTDTVSHGRTVLLATSALCAFAGLVPAAWAQRGAEPNSVDEIVVVGSQIQG